MNIARFVETADKRDRPPGYQRQGDVGPVLPGGVVHDGPAFKRRVAAVVAKDQPVARFPDRHGDHIVGDDLPGGRAGGIDIDAAFLFGARAGQRRQIVPDLRLEAGVGESNACSRGQVEVAQFARVKQQGALLALRTCLIARHHAPADDGPPNGIGGELQFHDRALELVEHRAQRLARPQPEGVFREFPRERFAGMVSQA